MIKERNLANSLKQTIRTAGYGPVTGDTFWVCKSALAAYSWLGARVPGDRLYTTLAAAEDAMVANSGQVCFIAPGHTESNATEIALATAGCEYVGLGRGPLQPTLTTTGAVNTLSLDAANITLANVGFAVPGIDAVTADIDVVGAGCQIIDTFHHGSTTAKNKVDIITLTATAHDTLINGARIYNKTVEVVGGIVFEGVCERVEIANVMVQDTVGFTDGSLSDEATALQAYIHDCVFSNAKADTVVVDFTSNTTGVMSNCFVNGRHTTIQSNVVPGTGMAFREVYGVEEAAKNGLLMPAVDAE